jgi:DNA-binding IclR family transcriptional regulator
MDIERTRMTDGRRRDRREPQQGGQAIRRALTVLRILAAGREAGAPLSEVVRATSLTRPTVHRIAQVLIEEGIVERNDQTGRYAIGRQVPELALARQSRSPLLVAAEPYLAQVSSQLGDTLFLTVRTGLDTLCVARRIGSYPIQVLSIEVGARRPLGVSSAGVAILAAMPAAEARKIVLANEARFLAYRTDLPTVVGQMRLARRRGGAATICATSASCKEPNRSRPGSGVPTANRQRRLPFPRSGTGSVRAAPSKCLTS